MINISIDKPTIPLSAGFTHSSTSWQISETKDFDGPLFAESIMDTGNLVDYKNLKNVEIDKVLFARAKIHFSNGKESNWSRTITLSSEQKGFKLSNTIVITPQLTIEDSLLDVRDNNIKVFGTEFKLYAGSGKHKSTTWEVTTLLGEYVWGRDEDEDNLTEAIVPKGKLDNDKMYIIKAIYHTDTNSKSNPGRLPFSTGKGGNP